MYGEDTNESDVTSISDYNDFDSDDDDQNKYLVDIGIENLSEILNCSVYLCTEEVTTYTTLQPMTNDLMSFFSNDLSSDILSVEPSYHVLQPWLANDFQQILNIATFQPKVPVVPIVPVLENEYSIVCQVLHFAHFTII